MVRSTSILFASVAALAVVAPSYANIAEESTHEARVDDFSASLNKRSILQNYYDIESREPQGPEAPSGDASAAAEAPPPPANAPVAPIGAGILHKKGGRNSYGHPRPMRSRSRMSRKGMGRGRRSLDSLDEIENLATREPQSTEADAPAADAPPAPASAPVAPIGTGILHKKGGRNSHGHPRPMRSRSRMSRKGMGRGRRSLDSPVELSARDSWSVLEDLD